jgi:putative FmdB family regulatory protein
MPLYTFECNNCGKRQDFYYKIDDCPKEMLCKICGLGTAHKILAVGHGGIQTDNDVKWLPSACETLQPDHEPRLETRGQYKKYLKDRNIQPKA